MTILGSKMQRLVSKIKTHNADLQHHQDDGSSDDELECAYSPPRDVPKGCLAVYAGSERRRFVISMRLLSNPLFRALLDRAAEEYGFGAPGALTIPCEAVLFEHFVWLLKRNDPTAARLELDELLNFYSAS